MAKKIVKAEKVKKASKEKEISLHDAVIHLQHSIDALIAENLKRDIKIDALAKKLKDTKVKKEKKEGKKKANLLRNNFFSGSHVLKVFRRHFVSFQVFKSEYFRTNHTLHYYFDQRCAIRFHSFLK